MLEINLAPFFEVRPLSPDLLTEIRIGIDALLDAFGVALSGGDGILHIRNLGIKILHAVVAFGNLGARGSFLLGLLEGFFGFRNLVFLQVVEICLEHEDLVVHAPFGLIQ